MNRLTNYLGVIYLLDDSRLIDIIMKIERPETISKQVNTILRDRISDGTYLPGTRLPAESDLAGEFSVSRATIRSVLARLDMEGLILRKQGDGTYVNERLPEVNTHSGGLWEFSRLIRSSGHEPSIKLLMAQYRPANEVEAEALDIEANSEVLTLERTFLADDKPVILAQNVLAAESIQVAKAKVDGSLNIREFVKLYCQREIAYTISDISATMPDERVASLLQKGNSEPLLKLVICFYDKNNIPLLYGLSYFNDTALNLRRVQAWT